MRIFILIIFSTKGPSNTLPEASGTTFYKASMKTNINIIFLPTIYFVIMYSRWYQSLKKLFWEFSKSTLKIIAPKLKKIIYTLLLKISSLISKKMKKFLKVKKKKYILLLININNLELKIKITFLKIYKLDYKK
jgi:hypothetical protein